MNQIVYIILQIIKKILIILSYWFYGLKKKDTFLKRPVHIYHIIIKFILTKVKRT